MSTPHLEDIQESNVFSITTSIGPLKHDSLGTWTRASARLTAFTSQLVEFAFPSTSQKGPPVPSNLLDLSAQKGSSKLVLGRKRRLRQNGFAVGPPFDPVLTTDRRSIGGRSSTTATLTVHSAGLGGADPTALGTPAPLARGDSTPGPHAVVAPRRRLSGAWSLGRNEGDGRAW